MKSVLGKSSVKKTMRVATAFTGVATGVAAFAPAAQAAPDNPPVPQPYTLWVNTSGNVAFIQVCGYKDVGSGEWYCTGVESNSPYFSSDKVHTNYFGTNWKRGKVNVYLWSSSSTEFGATCNTNGAYHGIFRTGGVSLSRGFGAPLGVHKGQEC
jgi:hypothetical protein